MSSTTSSNGRSLRKLTRSTATTVRDSRSLPDTVPPGDHLFEFGEVVAVVGRMDLGGEQRAAGVDERIGASGACPGNRSLDGSVVAPGRRGEFGDQLALATILGGRRGEGVPRGCAAVHLGVGR